MQQRERAILEEIIQYYMARQEAISARTLSKISSLSLSPTTIRNLMEDLSNEGFLTTEGVARGRIPTQKAFAIYVTEMAPTTHQDEPPPPEMDFFQEGASSELPGVVQHLGEYLSEQTGLVSLFHLPPRDEYPLNWVRFVSLPDNHVLVTMQSLFGDLWSKLLVAPDPFPEALLTEVSQFICKTYRGKSLEVIRNDIMAGEPKEILESMPSLGSAFRMLRKAFEWEQEPQRNFWGEENLFHLPEIQSPKHMEMLMERLKDPALLENGFAHGRKVEKGRISIGTEIGYQGLDNFAMVGFPFGWSNWEGQLAILGPMRMDYNHIFNLTGQIAENLNQFLSRTVKDLGCSA